MLHHDQFSCITKWKWQCGRGWEWGTGSGRLTDVYDEDGNDDTNIGHNIFNIVILDIINKIWCKCWPSYIDTNIMVDIDS